MSKPDPTPARFELHISPESDGISALDLIAANTSLSKQAIKKCMANGAVWLENQFGINRIRRAKKQLDSGTTVHVYYDQRIQQTQPEGAVLVADEGEYSIWNKPCGMYSQGSKWGDHCTIYRWAETHLTPQRQAYLVHRLDRAATGLMILAHNRNIASQFSKMFRDKKITKHYHAIVEGRLEPANLPFTITTEIDKKPATSVILDCRSGDGQDDRPNDRRTALVISIETGRKHQIRKHLSGLGHPIVGDRLYGSTQLETDLQLQSVLLQFICPVSKQEKTYQLER